MLRFPPHRRRRMLELVLIEITAVPAERSRGRHNPRVVKRKMSGFPTKARASPPSRQVFRAVSRCVLQCRMPFRDEARLLRRDDARHTTQYVDLSAFNVNLDQMHRTLDEVVDPNDRHARDFRDRPVAAL